MTGGNNMTDKEIIHSLENKNKSLENKNKSLEHEVNVLKAEIDALKRLIFGKKTEKTKEIASANQLSLFDFDEALVKPDEEFSQPDTEAVEVASHKRKKSKGKKARLVADLPTEEVHHFLEEEACHCKMCQSHLRQIGVSSQVEEIVYIPEKLVKQIHYHYAYECPECKKDAIVDEIVKGPVYRLPLRNSLCSASLLAMIAEKKFQYYLPLYRQEQQFKAMGLEVSRATLANWLIQVANQYIAPLMDYLAHELMAQDVLHADETPYRVNKSDKKTHYFWTFRSGEKSEHPIVLFYCHDGRRKAIVEEHLASFKGYLHTDGYAAYRQLPHTIPVGCLAHVRRKFIDATHHERSRLASEGLAYCNKLFELDCYGREQGYSAEQMYAYRMRESYPIFQAFVAWAEKTLNDISRKSKLARAIRYFMAQQEAIGNVYLDGRLSLSNNAAERGIRSIAMGRKNWLFSDSEDGGKANGLYHSLVETAKANGLCPKKYIEYLLTELPQLGNDLKNVEWEAYLPWHPRIQELCRENSK